MPIYEYRCAFCGFQKEVLRKISDSLLPNCPECGKPSMQKLVSAAGFQLKGKGWYATDFKDGAKPKPEDAKKTAEESIGTKPAAPTAAPPASK